MEIYTVAINIQYLYTLRYIAMHVLKNAMSLIQRKKLYSCLSKCMKLVNLSFVKGSLVIGMPVPHGCFVRRSCCQPSSKAVVNFC